MPIDNTIYQRHVSLFYFSCVAPFCQTVKMFSMNVKIVAVDCGTIFKRNYSNYVRSSDLNKTVPSTASTEFF